jgi:hypothetical protein
MFVLMCINISLVAWILVVVRSRTGLGQLDSSLGGRLEGVERRLRDDGDGLRRALTDMDQALRRETATGAKEGLALAFDKVQEGTKAQSEQLGRFGGDLQTALGKLQIEITTLAEKMSGAITDLRTLVVEKLTEAEGAAAEGRTQALRDTTYAIACTRDAIDNALTGFGEQQGERLIQMERAVREGGAATDARAVQRQKGRSRTSGKLSSNALPTAGRRFLTGLGRSSANWPNACEQVSMDFRSDCARSRSNCVGS